MRKLSVFSLVTLLISTLFAVQESQAQVYKWTDENGKVHFTDKPPKQLEVEPEVVTLAPRKTLSTTRFPSIAQLEPIKSTVTADARTVLLEHVSIEYEGSSAAAGALGKTYKYTREAGAKAARLRQSSGRCIPLPARRGINAE